jgi:citrate lyase subunit beta/citryl-CoA lyase
MHGPASSFPAVSYLFVPANRPERFDKACAAGADQVIIDLEDAVPPGEKDSARERLSDWLHPQKMVAIRINSSDSPWFEADLALCAQAGVAAVVVPKAATTDDIARVHAAGAASILPLIESAAGMANAAAIAAAPGVVRLLFGTIDFCVDLGIESEHRELDYFRSHLVLVSRLANIAAPVDGVTTAVDDVALIHADTLRGKRFGFGGKLCIHPKQLATVHAAYLPQPEELLWAQRVLAAAEAAAGAAVAVDGKMVDRPVMIKAERLVALAMQKR